MMSRDQKNWLFAPVAVMLLLGAIGCMYVFVGTFVEPRPSVIESVPGLQDSVEGKSDDASPK